MIPRHFKSRGSTSNPVLRPQGAAREQALNNPSRLVLSAGTSKGKRLHSPENVYLRPMMGKVREAVFSILTSFGIYEGCHHCHHLDLFAGSGSIGLESLSRGATHCTFVDLSEDCCRAVQLNVDACGFTGKEQVIRADALQTLKEPYSHEIPKDQAYQLITMGPPYEEIVYADLLEAVVNSPLLLDDTVVMIEYPLELGCLPPVIKSIQESSSGSTLVGVRNRRYGRTVVAIYVNNPTGRLHASSSSRPEEFVTLR